MDHHAREDDLRFALNQRFNIDSIVVRRASEEHQIDSWSVIDPVFIRIETTHLRRRPGGDP